MLPNIVATRSTEERKTINEGHSGAIIIAGSGMMSGGRIHHHLKNNIWRPECHLVIVGFQALARISHRVHGPEAAGAFQCPPLAAKLRA